MPSLIRIEPNDGVGDCGSRSEAIQWKEDGTIDKVVADIPIIGCSMLVGSLTARSYSAKDYWLTTVVTEIIEEKKDKKGHLIYSKFKTGNSIYEWKN